MFSFVGIDASYGAWIMNDQETPDTSMMLIDPSPLYDDGTFKEKKKTYSVKVLSMRDNQDDDLNYFVHGFESLEEATEYATRRMRASVEAARGESDVATRQCWFESGEDCGVVSGTYRGSEHLDFYIANVATEEEDDYMVLEPRWG